MPNVTTELKAQIDLTKGISLTTNGKLKAEAKYKPPKADKSIRVYMQPPLDATRDNLVKAMQWKEKTYQQLKAGKDPKIIKGTGAFTIREAYAQADADKWSQNDSSWRESVSSIAWKAVTYFEDELNLPSDTKLEDIGLTEIMKFKKFISKRPARNGGRAGRIAPRTVNKYMRPLETMFKVAKAHGKFSLDSNKVIPDFNAKVTGVFNANSSKNHSRRCFLYDEENGEVIRDEESEFYKFCDHYGDYYVELKYLVQLGIHTGMRLGETLKLRCSDVNLRLKKIMIPNWITKTDDARPIPLTEDALRIVKYFINNRVGSQSLIKSQISAILEREKIVGGKYQGTFHWSSEKVGRYFTKIKKLMGLEDDEDFTYHSTRHTAITRMLEAGVPVHEVKTFAGHRNLSTTEVYITTNLKKMDNCRDALSNHPASKRNSSVVSIAAEEEVKPEKVLAFKKAEQKG